jgi:hypothetical protein
MGVVATELESMLEDGASLAVGTVDRDGAPRVTRGWALSFDGPGRVRVAVSADDPVLVSNLDAGLVSVTAANVRTFHSIQLKGRVECVEPPDDDDLDRFRQQTACLFDAIHVTDGNPLELLRRNLPHDIVVIEFEIDDTFDQTPGPEAGASLASRGEAT